MPVSNTRECNHIQFMLDEIEAEIAALEDRCQLTAALRQLDAREAAGEPVTAVCAQTLRALIARQLATSPLAASRRKLAELRAILVATPVGAALPSNVVDLELHRARVASEKPVWRPFVAAARTAALSLILAVGVVVTAHHLPNIGRAAQIADIAAPITVPLARGFAEGF